MNTQLKYMPVLRLRQQEEKILKTFYFGDNIYPCVEIIKEIDRTPPTMRKGKKLPPKPPKSFEQIHIPIITSIHANKVFVDLPVHMKDGKNVKPEVISFLKKVVYKKAEKIKYLQKLAPLANKIIPVVSTYSQKTGEIDSIISQEKELRSTFKNLAFRTFPNTFSADLAQIQKIAKPEDFLIVDLLDYVADPSDEETKLLVEKLKEFNKCHIVIVRSAMADTITNVGLDHGNSVYEADNRLLNTFRQLNGHSFGDYVGIKKDKVTKGGGRSPGFIFYNPLDNKFYGFRGSVDEEGKSNQNLEDFETIIVPAVCGCKVVAELKKSALSFLSVNNRGWNMLLDIKKRIEKGQSPAKFKWIAMEHYLHCLRTKIAANHFN